MAKTQGRKSPEIKPTEAPELGEVSEINNIEFAQQFTFFQMGMQLVDWEYAERVVPHLRELADRQETMIIFKPDHPLKKIDAIRTQAEALEKICEGIKLLKEVDRLKLEAEKEGKDFAEIQKLFF